MSEQPRRGQPPGWPDTVPQPGTPGSTEGLIRWLSDTIPAATWRHRALEFNPWAAVTLASIGIHRDIETLREEYRYIGTLHSLIDDVAIARVQMAAESRAGELKALVERLAVIESLLSHGGAPPRGGSVTPPP
jgi:hypothetical protein